MRKIAISDDHGCRTSFEALLDQIAYSSTDHLYLLGDYIDRGPDSKGVLDFIMELEEQGYTLTCLRGNHEERMLNSRKDKTLRMAWLAWGGEHTMKSFGLPNEELEDIERPYWKFLQRLEWFHEMEEGYILVHGGLNFAETNPLEDRQSMIGLRNWYNDIKHSWLQGRVVVHGHTPAPKDQITQQLGQLKETPAIGIDAGCSILDRPGMGHLCAFDLTNQDLYFQPNVD